MAVKKSIYTFLCYTGSSESSGSESASSYSSSSSNSSRGGGRPSKPIARTRDKTVIERKVTVKKRMFYSFLSTNIVLIKFGFFFFF